MPYLKYIASTSENKRLSHMAFYGRILPVDDPFRQKNYPPNGYGCKCSVRQLTAKQALRERQEDIAADVLKAKSNPEYQSRFTRAQIENSIKGVLDDATAAAPIPEHEFINPRTGQKTMVPQSVTPSFAYPIGDRLEAMQQLYRDKIIGHVGREKADKLMDAFSSRISDYLLAKIHSIAPAGSMSERVQFEMARLVGLPPQVSAAVYDKMLQDEVVMQTLTNDVQQVIKTVKEIGHTDKTMALHIGTISQQVLAAINDKKLPEPQTAVISFGSSRYGHGTRTHKSHALDDAFWMALPHELRQPEAVYYDAGGHGNHKSQKPALLFVYPAEKGKKKLVVTVDYVMKDYRSPVSKTKETLLTNMVNTGEVMETHFLEADKNLELVWKK